MTLVKICGIKTPDALDAALQAKADFIGFVFYPKSPRDVQPSLAAQFITRMNPSVKSVGLFVDPNDDQLDQVLKLTKLDFIQLHGNETPNQIAHIKSKFKTPVIKAIKIADQNDLIEIDAFKNIADILLFDAKPPVTSNIPGGNGHAFDWNILKNLNIQTNWMLSGGLTIDNVQTAIQTTSAKMVDVSSGVESAKGIKDINKIHTFIRLAKQA